MNGKLYCTIIAGGDVQEKIDLHDREKQLLICADGGYFHALEQGIEPDVLMGDFDSYTGKLPEKVNIIRYPEEKDFSDTWAAVQYGKEQGAEIFELYGGCGGERFDHTIANLQIMRALAKEHLQAVMFYQNQKLVTLSAGETFSVPAEKFPEFSVFALSDVCRGVSITKAKYKLHNAELTNQFPLGLSNSCQGNAEISVQEGEILLVLRKK